MQQLKLPGWEPIEKQWESERRAAERKAHEEWLASSTKGMADRYPPTTEEWDIMLSGIRLCRFVSGLECEPCNFACEDHTLDCLFLTKVCLKDYYALMHKLGIK